MRLPIHRGDVLSREAQGEALARRGASIMRTMARSLQIRASDDNCDKDSSLPECQKPVSTQTTPIVIGTVVPLAIACCILFFLHRRSKKRQAIEDANDPHKSLDFGVDMPSQPGKAKKKPFGKAPPEMTITEVGMEKGGNRRDRGLSMDMGMDSPYLLPHQLQGSRESLHSMSRSVQDQHDPYRPVNMMTRSSQETSRSPRPWAENGSVYSQSTVRTADNSSLLANAQRMSQSQGYPTRGDSMASDESSSRQMHSARSQTPTRKASQLSSDPMLANISENDLPKTTSPPPLPPPPKDATPELQMPPPRKSSMPSSAMPPRKSSMSAASQSAADRHLSDASFYGDDIPPPPPPPKIEEPQSTMAMPIVQEPEGYDSQYDIDPTDMYTGRFSIDNSAPTQQHYHTQDNRMSVMGLRPLPPDDPAENAEQRANRIRSFYKEYFDDSRPGPAQGGYYEDSDYYMDSAIYDPDTGTYIMPGQAPFAQPMGRRAMTPPPRAGPRFAGADMHRRQYSTMSAGRPGPRGRPPPKKQLPPPKALTSLPTPHMLREDTALIMNPIDFAPPTSFREHQNGRRPDSPMGIQRPYSPSVKAYSPLVPAFDDLHAMPSPHHLRKSGAFMPLDFAPPSKLRIPGETGSMSDAGSIRSARSGISAMQMDAVRAGAYRVSRIPKEFVTSKDDLTTQLRPKMDLVSRA